jgi:hypothetical protein
MGRSDSVLVAIELLTRECRSDEFLESEEFIVNQLSNEPASAGVSGLSPECRRHVNRVGLYYASLGVLAAFGALEEKMIISIVPARARRAWFALEPYILAERTLKSPTYLSYFEHLVCLIAEADLPKLHQSLNLRQIGARSAQFRQDFLANAAGVTDTETRPRQDSSPVQR